MKIVFAKTSTSVSLGDGRTMMVLYGSHWSAADPVVKQYPELFTDDARFGITYSDTSSIAVEEQGAPVEAATAEPGEKRATRGPSSRG